MLQFENKTPKLLKEGQIISIPKGVYHRIIKGDGNLIIKIKEY
jgi:quercetin dioxygenase-like cupin family protein